MLVLAMATPYSLSELVGTFRKTPYAVYSQSDPNAFPYEQVREKSCNRLGRILASTLFVCLLQWLYIRLPVWSMSCAAVSDSLL
jgi:hypothetical protein